MGRYIVSDLVFTNISECELVEPTDQNPQIQCRLQLVAFIEEKKKRVCKSWSGIEAVQHFYQARKVHLFSHALSEARRHVMP